MKMFTKFPSAVLEDIFLVAFGINCIEALVEALDTKRCNGKCLDKVDIDFIKKVIKEHNLGTLVAAIRKQLKIADELADSKRLLKKSYSMLYRHEREISKLELRLGWYDFSLKKPAVSKYRPINLIFHNRSYEMEIGYYNGINFSLVKGTIWDHVLAEDVKYWKYVQTGRIYVIPAGLH